MKKIQSSIILLLVASHCVAQNLVPNPSFEDTIACPTMGGQISLAIGWQNWGITPDYFNSCNPGLLGTPVNGYGFQTPEEGNAYAGFGCNVSTQPNVREFIGRQLSQSLVIGQNYYASIYVSLSDFPTGACAISKIGMKFSSVPFSSSSPPPLTNSAHVYTNSIVSDTINWTKISGWFTADSAYDYIGIGNFFDDAHIDTLNCPTNAGTESYYYFDMVCVSTDSLTCNGEIMTGVQKPNNDSFIKVFPQPAAETLNISSSSAEIENVEIYSAVGKLIYAKSFGSINNVIIPVNKITDGIYLIKIVTNKNIFCHKVQIIH